MMFGREMTKQQVKQLWKGKLKAHKEKWELKSKYHKEWLNSNTLRWRNMLHHVGEASNTRPKWF